MSSNISGVTYTYPVPECFRDEFRDETTITISALRTKIGDVFGGYGNIRNNLLTQLNRIFGTDVELDENDHIALADFIKSVPSNLTQLENALEEAESELKTKEDTLLEKENALGEAERNEATVAQKWSRGQATREEVDVAIAAREAAESERNQALAERDQAKAVRDQAKIDAGKGFRVFTDCDESTAAYKFYACQIIDEINKLSDYINEAEAILAKWDILTGHDVSSLFYADVVRLECLEQFCNEIHQKFGARYYYDFDEDNWKLTEDNYLGYVNPGMTLDQIDTEYDTYDSLYNTTVKSNSKVDNAPKVLDCFNELNLLDRLKYIKVYYDIKETGTTNYVFPGSKEVGFPCVAESGQDQTDVRIAQLEKFYLGYLVDRDGPINAFCSLYEVKVRALQETLNEMKKRIDALNVYLDFINRGLDLLNQSQSKKLEDTDEKEYHPRIPVSAVFAMAYLCGQQMYNLFEYNGNKYLVIPGVLDSNKYILVRADDSGKRFFLGDSVSAENSWWGNGYCCGHGGTIRVNGTFRLSCEDIGNCPSGSLNGHVEWKSVNEVNKAYYSTTGKVGVFYAKQEESISDFKLPKPLTEVETVSIDTIAYVDEYSSSIYDDNKHSSMMESWTNAFNKKIEFINDGIQIVNTDIEQIRNKINTYQSQATTFRNRVHDVYVNTVRKTKG